LSARGTIAGFVVGAVVGGILAALVGWVVVGMETQRVRRGWKLVPVIVAAQDIPEGATLELDLIQQHPIPEQFVTASLTRPNALERVLGQVMRHGVSRGDPIRWQDLDEPPGEAAVAAEE
jgi:pilus assembly protein CpaB